MQRLVRNIDGATGGRLGGPVSQRGALNAAR